MPDRITLNALLLCCVLTLPVTLRGQTPVAERNPFETVRHILPRAWYFAYENLEKAIAGNPVASSRYVFKEGDGWKFAIEQPQLVSTFYTSAFNDASWATVALPRISEETEDGNGNLKEDHDRGGEGVILYRRDFELDEHSIAGKEFFLFLDFPGEVSCWVNGRSVAPGPEDAGAASEAGGSDLAAGAELNITGYLQAGKNFVAIRVEGDRSSYRWSGNYPGAGEAMLYVRPETHFAGIGIRSAFKGNEGFLEIDLAVENRMDSVRERFWGVLREPLYSTIDVKAQLIDSKGNTILDLKKDNNKKIQGGDRALFHFEGKVAEAQAWNHETPVRYRLNLLLLDEAGNVLEVVSRQIGFRTIENSAPESLLVNGTRVPLRIYDPGARPAYGLSPQQMLEDIRQLKQGNYNAVPASSYRRYRQWYELCATHGVYVLDGGTPAGQGLYGSGSNPALVTVPEEALAGAGNDVVELELADFLKGTVRITNEFALRDLSGYYLEWSILRNGEKVDEGRLQQLDALPGEHATVSLGYKMRFYEGNDYFLNLRLRTKAADELIPADFAVASRQFRLSPYQYQENYEVDKGLIDMTDGPGSIALNGYDFRIEFDKSTGQITRYSYRGKELMSAGPELGFPDAGKELAVGSIAEDGQPAGDTLGESRVLWNQAVRESSLLEYKVTEDVNGNYYLSFTKVLLGGDARLFQRFRVDGRGAILVENVFVKMNGDYPVMPGFGTIFRLPEEFRQMEWYGREPAAFDEVGIYADTIPGRSGGAKGDVRWVRLTRNDGYGLLIRQENELLNLIVRRERQEGPVLLSVDLSHDPVPFTSWNFSYRVIPYISSESAQ